MPKPLAEEHPSYFSKYINLVDANSVAEAVTIYAPLLQKFYSSLPEEKAGYAYAPGKWTIKDLLQHVIDTERIFSYRVVRIARKDKTPLASFDENSYAANAAAGNRTLASLVEEFLAVRKSTDLLLNSLSEAQLAETGVASNMPVTANAIGFIIFGHLLHHKQVLEERYL
ncbi:MAG: DinB family protein [Bacteroidota bacterium]|nr:DinB family protein [Bacteroidota bacterium]